MSRAKTVIPPRPLPWVVEQLHSGEHYWFAVGTALCYFDAASLVANRCSNDEAAKHLRVLYHGAVVWSGEEDGFKPQDDLDRAFLAAERASFQRILAPAQTEAQP